MERRRRRRKRKHIGFSWDSRKKLDHQKDLDIRMRIIL
jgi:hypothetical protein